VATAECFLLVAGILEEQLGLSDSNNGESLEEEGEEDTSSSDFSNPHFHVAAVVSAMGGTPKVTDLLLNTVSAAAERSSVEVEETLREILERHSACLRTLFPEEEEDSSEERERLMGVISSDLEDVRDILKTVSLMKWRASRISELVSGYGELWSAQILTALMRKRAAERASGTATSADASSASSLHPNSTPPKHEFVYLDARRVITVDEEAIQNGAVVWDVSAEKLKEVYAEESRRLSSSPDQVLLHFVATGYVASNTRGVATTLQRDGSDYTAAILGRLLRAECIQIWTDVDGVMSADPRRVPLAQVLPEVSFSEAMELGASEEGGVAIQQCSPFSGRPS
jgi:aspartokinase/homoserine dehydrogenase 1